MPRLRRLPDRSRGRSGGRPGPRSLPVEQIRDRLGANPIVIGAVQVVLTH